MVGLDPAEPGDAGSEQGLAVVGQAVDNELYVIASEGHRGSVGSFLDRAIAVAQEHGATIVVERNQGRGRHCWSCSNRSLTSAASGFPRLSLEVETVASSHPSSGER